MAHISSCKLDKTAAVSFYVVLWQKIIFLVCFFICFQHASRQQSNHLQLFKDSLLISPAHVKGALNL